MDKKCRQMFQVQFLPPIFFEIFQIFIKTTCSENNLFDVILDELIDETRVICSSRSASSVNGVVYSSKHAHNWLFILRF